MSQQDPDGIKFLSPMTGHRPATPREQGRFAPDSALSSLPRLDIILRMSKGETQSGLKCCTFLSCPP